MLQPGRVPTKSICLTDQFRVPILESLDICAYTAGNVTVGKVLIEAKNGVRKAAHSADPLREH